MKTLSGPPSMCGHFIALVLLGVSLKGTASLEVDLTSDSGVFTRNKISKEQDLPLEGDLGTLLSNDGNHTNTSQPKSGGKIEETHSGVNKSKRGTSQVGIFNFKLDDARKRRDVDSEMKDSFPIRTGTMCPVDFNHRSILITKLLPPPQYGSKLFLPGLFSDMRPMLLPNDIAPPLLLPKRHQYFRPNTLFPHFDPMFGLIDQMMDRLIQPIVNRPYNEQIDTRTRSNEDDSSLKFWIQDQMFPTKNSLLNKENKVLDTGESYNSEPIELNTEDSLSDVDYPDYKTDLWRKFMRNDKNDSKSDDESNNKSDEGSNERSHTNGLKSKSESSEETQDLSDEGNKKEDAWWYRLISPRKPIILRNHKKNTHPREFYSGTENKSDEISQRKREINKIILKGHPIKPTSEERVECKENDNIMQSKAEEADEVKETVLPAFTGGMLTIALLMLMYMSCVLPGQCGTGRTTIASMMKPVARVIPQRCKDQGPSPPSYSVYVPSP